MRVFAALALLFFATSVYSEPEYPKQGPDIYDTQVDGSLLIAEALAKAKTSGKNVLVDMGANWCIWCRRLHNTFETDPAIKQALEKNFVVVMIDVNSRKGPKRNADVDERYGTPSKFGLPVLVVLDSNGKQLTTQETGSLENGKDGHDPQKVAAFLSKWAPSKK